MAERPSQKDKRTTKTYDWVSPNYRPIPEWPTYIMSAGLDVWSLSRAVNCRGGKTRLTTTRQLVPDGGRVRLAQNGTAKRFHVENQLFPLVFPELKRTYQPFCRHGHPLMRPLLPIFGSWEDMVRVAYWGTGNRTCLWCSDPPAGGDSGYSSIYGVAGTPYYSELPAQPKQTCYDLVTTLSYLKVRGFVSQTGQSTMHRIKVRNCTSNRLKRGASK